MRGSIGSLNAAVAGSILLFEALAQRDAGSPEPAAAARPTSEPETTGRPEIAVPDAAPSATDREPVPAPTGFTAPESRTRLLASPLDEARATTAAAAPPPSRRPPQTAPRPRPSPRPEAAALPASPGREPAAPPSASSRGARRGTDPGDAELLPATPHEPPDGDLLPGGPAPDRAPPEAPIA
jgi:hypothetical protein